MSVARHEVKVHPAVKQWAAMCEDPALDALPYKIETDRHGKIIMSPASSWHGDFQFQIGHLLKQLMPPGRVLMEVGILTSNGIKVPDAAWSSLERFRPHRRAYCQPVAPEICVEVASPSNSTREMQMKKRLYFDAGASEVWFCNKNGGMTFFSSDDGKLAIPRSKPCPDFPLSVDW